jgi:hypothetical protein
MSWSKSFVPKYPIIEQKNLTQVNTTDDISKHIQNFIRNNKEKAGILLSGGIDSAIVASFCPKGTKAYSIKFDADGSIDETIMAKKYADYYGLDLKVIYITWDDYRRLTPLLIQNKKSGLHAVEVALYKVAQHAVSDGINQLYCGNGADSNFGGMDKLLSKDWRFDDFVQRYTYIEPSLLLKNPVSLLQIFEHFRKGETIDSISFLRNIHGVGIIQAFTNALSAAGCVALEPYESMTLGVPLDLLRIRNGEPKYLLRQLFKGRYPKFDLPNKIPFARPMDIWLRNWDIPNRKEFLDNRPEFNGEQKWLIYCLDIILNFLEEASE